MENYKVSYKDWERMQDLIDRGKDGKDVAEKIKSAPKAVARFVAGIILLNHSLENYIREDRDGNKYFRYSGQFLEFGLKAVKLGAKMEDIIRTYNSASIPEDFRETHVTKNSYTGFTGSLRRLADTLAREHGLTYSLKLKTSNSSGWSYETFRLYRGNGRCWPLSYTLTFQDDFESLSFPIVVVTDEGGGNYGYDFRGSRVPWRYCKRSITEEVAEKFGGNQ